MASNHGNLNRDLIGNSLFIKGKRIIDEGRNLTMIKHASVGSLKVRNDVAIDGALTVNGPIYNNYIPVAQGPFQSIIPSVDLTGKVIVVTGVSRGQGRATAQILRAAGAIIIGSSRFSAGYPSSGQFLKPCFIPQLNPLSSTPDIPQTCDYFLTMDLADDSSMQAFSTAVHNLFLGPLSGKNLYAVVNSAGRFGFGEPVASMLSPTALSNTEEQYKISSISHMLITSLLFDLMPTTSDARVVFINSITGLNQYADALGPSLLLPYTSAKCALHNMARTLTMGIGALAAENPGTYTNFRVCSVYPNNVRVPNGIFTDPSQGVILGYNNPAIIQQLTFFLPLIGGAPAAQDQEQTGATVIQLLTMLDPPLSTACTNTLNYPLLQRIYQPAEGLPASNDINDTVTLLKFVSLNNELGYFQGLAIGFPAIWDIIPSTPGSLIDNYTGSPVVQTALPLHVVGFPLGDSTFDFEYKINNGSWLGSGTFIFGNPYPPLYTSTIDVSAYSGQTITLYLRVKTHGGSSVTPIPTGNAIQTDANQFSMKLIIQ
jgi:NAD(P)-dependent dehydrogenase (short-subunit alcohol dehydrogenase family)